MKSISRTLCYVSPLQILVRATELCVPIGRAYLAPASSSCWSRHCLLYQLHTSFAGISSRRLSAMTTISSFVTRLSRHFPCVRPAAAREIWRGLARRSTTYNSLRMASDLTPAPNASQVTYQFMDESIEPFEGYAAGGYYPLQIGHCLGPYHIVHKLGHGDSSTIWLGLDQRRARYVAVKITVSGHNRPLESSILRSLWSDKESTGNTQTGIATIPAILDEFEVEGPEIEGSRQKYHCLVTKPARMSLAEAREMSDRRLFQPSVAHGIAAQLIQAVTFLHSRGIVHADKLLKTLC
jgi:hypothetical protein